MPFPDRSVFADVYFSGICHTLRSSKGLTLALFMMNFSHVCAFCERPYRDTLPVSAWPPSHPHTHSHSILCDAVLWSCICMAQSDFWVTKPEFKAVIMQLFFKAGEAFHLPPVELIVKRTQDYNPSLRGETPACPANLGCLHISKNVIVQNHTFLNIAHVRQLWPSSSLNIAPFWQYYSPSESPFCMFENIFARRCFNASK